MFPKILVEQVKKALKEREITSYFDDKDLLFFLNSAQGEITERISWEIKDSFRASYEITTIANQATYALPVDFLSLISLKDSQEISVYKDGSGLRYSLEEKDLRFEPTPTPASTYTLYYHRSLPAMHWGKAAAGAANTITFPKEPVVGEIILLDDYYNRAEIVILSGEGEGQRRTISDYAASTRIATVSANWDTAPDGTSEYCILSGLPRMQSLADAMVFMAASKAIIIDGARKSVAQDFLNLVYGPFGSLLTALTTLAKRDGKPTSPTQQDRGLE